MKSSRILIKQDLLGNLRLNLLLDNLSPFAALYKCNYHSHKKQEGHDKEQGITEVIGSGTAAFDTFNVAIIQASGVGVLVGFEALIASWFAGIKW